MLNHVSRRARALAAGLLCLAVLGFLVAATGTGDAARLWIAAAPAPVSPLAAPGAPISPLDAAGAPVSPVSPPATPPNSAGLGAPISPLGMPGPSSTEQAPLKVPSPCG